MAIEKDNLRNGLVPEEHRLESAAQTKHVPGVTDPTVDLYYHINLASH